MTRFALVAAGLIAAGPAPAIDPAPAVPEAKRKEAVAAWRSAHDEAAARLAAKDEEETARAKRLQGKYVIDRRAFGVEVPRDENEPVRFPSAAVRSREIAAAKKGAEAAKAARAALAKDPLSVRVLYLSPEAEGASGQLPDKPKLLKVYDGAAVIEVEVNRSQSAGGFGGGVVAKVTCKALVYGPLPKDAKPGKVLPVWPGLFVGVGEREADGRKLNTFVRVEVKPDEMPK